MTLLDENGASVEAPSEKGLIFEAEKRRLTPKEERKLAKELHAQMTPRGKLGLPDFLDKRRWEFCIPDEAFRGQAAYDRVAIFQLDEQGDDIGETFVKGGSILMPEATKQDRRMTAPRGIIITAGLEALDNLRSNGMDLGHIVVFTKYSPYRYKIRYFNHKMLDILFLRDGDVIWSEDTRKAMRDGKMRIEWRDMEETDSSGRKQIIKRHYWMVKRGKSWEVWNPTMPWIPEDD